MKKQFFRVKQLADQTFSRAGKTEVLSDDLQAADKRVELIRTACQNTSKKLSSSLQTQGQDASAREKRLKKNAEYLLGIAMLESGTGEEDGLLRHVISECGKLQMCLANACVDYEARVEANVLAALQQVCDVDVPNIMKHKRNLAKLRLDMDSARARYQAAVKHNPSSSQGNKVESIKDELEEAQTKVEQCRDALACEMFQLIAKEAELSATVLELARLQRSYHQTALATLDEIMPELESSIQDCSVKPMFAVSLEEHLRVTGRKIAYPIELCVCALNELALDEEGLFRVAGGASKIRRMKLSLDANCMNLATALEYRDPHVIASVLKSYLRQLPEPLLTHRLHDQWISAAKVTGSNDARLQALWAVLQQLPSANLDNLRYLVKFLALLSQNQEVNKMTPQNIAIVMAPNLLWSPADDGSSIGVNMNTASLHSIILDSLVSYSDWFFPGDYDMFLTLSREAVVNGHTRSSSGDTHLINTDPSGGGGGGGGMKRTQSNSSLSEDQSSPPQGSPKPMTRNRKNKQPAPVPPVNPPRDSLVVHREPNRNSLAVEKESNRNSSIEKESNRHSASSEKESNRHSASSDKESNRHSATSEKESNRLSSSSEKESNRNSVFLETESKRDSIGKESNLDSMIMNAEEKKSDESSVPVPVVGGESQLLIGFERLLVTEKKPDEGDQLERSEEPEKIVEIHQIEPEAVISTKQDENMLQMSPPENVPSTKPTAEPVKPAKPEPMYSTLERKRLLRPTPAPRTLAEGAGAEKPAVPERPATLQRPLSSSFRLTRTLDTDNLSDGPVSLERAHVYSVDKQQVAIIQVSDGRTHDKKECWEKPERPPKPDILQLHCAATATPHTAGHKRTASEGNIVDNSSGMQKSPVNPARPPRPTPPPPPVPKAKESTDL